MSAKTTKSPTPPAAILIIQSPIRMSAWKFYPELGRREAAQPAGGDFDIVARWCERQGYQRRGALVNGLHPACLWIAPGLGLAATASQVAALARLELAPATCSYFAGERRIGTTRTRQAILRSRASAGVADALTDLAITPLPSWDVADAATLAQRRASNALPPADWQPDAGTARAWGL